MSRIGFGVFPCGWEAVVLRANKLDIDRGLASEDWPPERSSMGRSAEGSPAGPEPILSPYPGLTGLISVVPAGAGAWWHVPPFIRNGYCGNASCARPDGPKTRPHIRHSQRQGRGQECPRHTGLARGGGQDFVMGHARPSLQQEFFIFGIEHGFLRIGTGKGFDGVP